MKFLEWIEFFFDEIESLKKLDIILFEDFIDEIVILNLLKSGEILDSLVKSWKVIIIVFYNWYFVLKKN